MRSTRAWNSFRGQPLRRKVGWVIATPLLAAGVLTVDPAVVGLSGVPGFLHLVSFRGWAALGFLGSGAIVALQLLFPRPTRPWFRMIVGGTLIAIGLAHGAVVLTRGVAAPEADGRTDLVVVSFNTLASSVSPADLADLIDGQAGADRFVMVSLPETVADVARQTAAVLAGRGRSFQVFSTVGQPGKTGTTSLLVSTELGRYRQVPAPDMLLGAARAEPVDGIGPTLVAVHPGAPVPAVGFRNWARYVSTAADQCRDTPNSVVAGDFNATVDHAPLRDLGPCIDAASAAGRGGEGTWPASLPAALAAPIDHVLFDGSRFRVLGTRTFRVGDSDHRALIARLSSIGNPAPAD